MRRYVGYGLAIEGLAAVSAVAAAADPTLAAGVWFAVVPLTLLETAPRRDAALSAGFFATLGVVNASFSARKTPFEEVFARNMEVWQVLIGVVAIEQVVGHRRGKASSPGTHPALAFSAGPTRTVLSVNYAF